MKTAIIIFLCVVVIVTTRISLKIQIQYNITENLGKLKIVLFNIFTLVNLKVTFLGLYIKLIRNNGKEELIKLDLNDKSIRFVNDLQGALLSKIYLIHFNSFAIVGNDDAFKTTGIYSVICSINKLLFKKVKNFEKDAQISMQVIPKFAQNILSIKVNSKVILSIFDLTWGVTKALLERRNYIYE